MSTKELKDLGFTASTAEAVDEYLEYSEMDLQDYYETETENE